MEYLGLTDFYRGKRVFVTGHTGFKGSWLCRVLLQLGAEVYGFALEPQGENLFELCRIEKDIHSKIGDIRNAESLLCAYKAARADLVFHLAAQPLVQESYRNPIMTFETNVMGTLHLFNCVRLGGTARSVVNITTDKVYKNVEWPWGYRETDALGGRDPYSGSKSCAELVTDVFRDSYFAQTGVRVSTLRAGNVIGGGDFSENRLVPDCIRAALLKRPAILRNPYATRPYQHVLEPLFAYLLVGMEQWARPEIADSYNVGPGGEGCKSNGALADLFCKHWGEGMAWEAASQADRYPEAKTLRLDCAKITDKLGWRPRYTIDTAVAKTVEWAKAHRDGENLSALMARQIDEYRTGRKQDV